MTHEEEVFLDQKKAELVVKLYNMFGVILESKPLLKEDFYNWLETILIHHAMLLNSNKHEPLVMPLADLEKLRLEYEKKFTYGGITGIAAFQNANPVEVWEFFITQLPKIIKTA